MEREIERFEVITAGGKRYTIIHVQEYRTHRPMKGPPVEIAGLRRLDLLGGGHANYRDGVEFEIVHTGEIARRI